VHRKLLNTDARNRAVRTFLVGITTDVGVAVALVLYNAFTKANGWGDFDWSVLGFLLSKTAITTGGSYVLRRFLDGSSLPTPLPPAPVPEPNEDVAEPDPTVVALSHLDDTPPENFRG
jgi:hypothetical protein